MFYNGKFNHTLIEAESVFEKQKNLENGQWVNQSFTELRENVNQDLKKWSKVIQEGRMANKIKEDTQTMNKIIEEEYKVTLNILNGMLIITERLRRHHEKIKKAGKNDRYKNTIK